LKKILFLISIFCTTLFLFSCTNVEPLENPHPELFDIFIEEEDYLILKRAEIDDSLIFPMIALVITYSDGTETSIGLSTEYQYRVLYKEEYYSLQAGNQLGLFYAENLIEYGIIHSTE